MMGGYAHGVPYCEATAFKILERLGTGESMRSICRDDAMPHRVTVDRWRKANPEFDTYVEEVTRAATYDLIEETREIADDGRNDWMEVQTKNGTHVQLNNEAVQRSKLRVWQRLEEAKRKRPDLFGDSMTLRGDKDNPVQTRSGMTDEDLERIAASGKKPADG